METSTIAVVGLGYVGLPLAVEFAKVYHTIGFDISEKRVKELHKGEDSTNEVADLSLLKTPSLVFTTNAEELKKADFVVVAVPTPINDRKEPDMGPVLSASKTVGQNLKKGAIVVYESTVYPGATEAECVPVLEKESGMKCGAEFKIAYSPERIVPGDRVHTLRTIVKIVSGMDAETLGKVAEVYSKVVDAGVYRAKSLKVAEAAKMIENVQRDVNIALMNELSLAFRKMDINTRDVVDAAGSKWNFVKYVPGCVGGHCIGVDPYYFIDKSTKLGHVPKLLMHTRELNEHMPLHIADIVMQHIKSNKKPLHKSKVLLMGASFKENVPDLRNTKAKDIIHHLRGEGVSVSVYEPHVEEEWLQEETGLGKSDFEVLNELDAVIVFSPHKEFAEIKLEKLKEKCSSNPLLFDMKGFYNKEAAEKSGFVYDTL